MNETITPEHQLPTGTILNGKYEIIRTLGEGGFGITYMGHNIVLDIPVAIKEYYPHGYANRSASHDLSVTITDNTKNAYFSTWKEKFLEEAKTLSKFEKIPNIVNVLDFFEQNGTAYIVMEYLSGVTLSNFVKVNGPFKANDLCAIMIPLLRSLDKIHQAKLIHRDISPDNIMVMEDGSLKLYDFGAAREYSEESQKSLSIMLKPGYAPEEQYRSRGNQGPWTDVYAVCATMYFCITGVRPDDSVQRVFSDELKAPSELGVSISLRIEEAIMIGMSVRAEDRFQSANALANALGRALALSTVSDPPVPVTKTHTEPQIIGSDCVPKPQTLSQSGVDEYSKVPAQPEIPAEKQKGKISLHAIKQKLLDKSNKKAFIGIASSLVVCGIVTGIAVIAVNDASKRIESSSLSQSNAPEQQSDSVGGVSSDTVSSPNTSGDTGTNTSSSKLEQSTSVSSSIDTSTSFSKPEQSTSASSSTNTSTSSFKPNQSTSASSSTNTSTSSKPVSSQSDQSFNKADRLLAYSDTSSDLRPKLVEKADRLEYEGGVILKGSVPESLYSDIRDSFRTAAAVMDFYADYSELYNMFTDNYSNITTFEKRKSFYSGLVPMIDKCLSKLLVIKQFAQMGSGSELISTASSELADAWEEYLQLFRQCSQAASSNELSELIDKRIDYEDSVCSCDNKLGMALSTFNIATKYQSEQYWSEYSQYWTDYTKKFMELVEYMDSIDSITEENMNDHLEKVRSKSLMLTWYKVKMNGYVAPYGKESSFGVIFDFIEKCEAYADACESFFSSPYSIAVVLYAQKIDDCRAEVAEAYTKAIEAMGKMVTSQ